LLFARGRTISLIDAQIIRNYSSDSKRERISPSRNGSTVAASGRARPQAMAFAKSIADSASYCPRTCCG
jgi:hypothetical protein